MACVGRSVRVDQRGGDASRAGFVADGVVGSAGRPRVIFRLKAPEAFKIILQFEGLRPMTRVRRESGRLPFGPVEPEIYQYNFVVGGLRILDPKNPNLRNGWAIDAKPRGLPRTIFPGSVLRNHRAASKIQLSAFKTAASPEPTYCGYRYR
jgi:hypothetical protein